MIICSALLGLALLVTQSCVDKSYDWDDMDTTGVVNIPPVMLGNIDVFYLDKLATGILPDGIPVYDHKIVLSDTIAGLFDGDAIQDFFFDGAGTVKIEAKADVVIKEIPTNGRIMLYFNVINNEKKRIQEIVIPEQELRKGNDQTLTIEIASQYMRYMGDANSLELTIVILTNDGRIQIHSDDYIFLKSVIVKTGGYHIDL